MEFNCYSLTVITAFIMDKGHIDCYDTVLLQKKAVPFALKKLQSMSKMRKNR